MNVSEYSDQQRHQRVQSAMDFLFNMAEEAVPVAQDPILNRLSTLDMYYRDGEELELAEDFIENGDNFLDAGWQDPFKSAK